MNTLFILAHPEPGSFNAQLVRAGRDFLTARGDQVTVIDLYAEGFDPVERAEHYRERADTAAFAPLAEQRHAFRTGSLPADVSRHIAALEAADLVVFQFPIWWHTVPAMLKGWFDRVFVSGGLYTSTMRYDRGGTLEQILWPAQFSLYYMGFDVLAPQASFGVAGHGYSYAPPEQFRAQFAGLTRRFLDRLAAADSDPPLRFPGWVDWDALGQPKQRPNVSPATLTGAFCHADQ